MTQWHSIDASALPADLSKLGLIPLGQDPRWLHSRLAGEGKSLRYFTLGDARHPHGMAPFLVHHGVLSYCLGETTLFGIPVHRYAMQGMPLCDGVAQLEGLFEPLRKAIGNRGVVFLEGVPLDSSLAELLTSASSQVLRHFHVIPYGPVYARRLITLVPGAGFDDYLASLGSSTRKDIRRTRRDFLALAGGVVRTTLYTGPDQADELSLALAKVSRKTYQYHLLGLGLENTAAHTEQLRAAAAGGWLRAYVLWIDDVPIAFKLGYRDTQTYYGHHAGYDPAVSKLQPGIYLHTEVMTDLLKNGIYKFDFLSGDSLYKQRMSNAMHEERHFYLIPRGCPGTISARLLVMVNSLSEAIGRWLDKSGLKERIRRWVRKAAIKRADPGS